MKFLLVYFLVVQIPTVIYAYRRHGTSSRNSASFLLRKVCVEVAGLKEEIADLKEEKADFKEEIADFKEEIADLKEENADFKEEIADLKEEIADLKEENQAMMQPVDGQWINWMQWSGCTSVTCGSGTRTRQRLCLDPRPSNGGSNCTGPASETEPCEIISCEVDGQWINWLQWSGCSATCGPGTRTRQRLCLDPRPSNGGSNCTGLASETEPCEIISCEESSSPYSAFAIYGVSPTNGTGVALWSSTKLNIAPDNGAHYNTSSGKYCAEYYGTYIFQLHLYKTSPTETLSCDIKKDHDGSLETLVRVSARPDTLTGSSSTIVDLQNGDCVYVGECTNFHKLNSMTSFSGALLDLLD